MAIRQLHILGLIIFLNFILCTQISAQSSLNYHWYVNANVGLTQLYGDLETSTNQFSKLDQETGIGYGVRLGKYISPTFATHLQLINGNFQGLQKDSNLEYQTNFTEIHLGATINLNNLFNGKKERLFNVYGIAGIGAIIFKGELRDISTGEVITNLENGVASQPASETALSFPLGLGFDFRVADRWFLNAETGLRLSTTDELDAYLASGRNDAYYYSSIGVSYHFKKGRKAIVPEVIPPAIAEEPVDPYADYVVDLTYLLPDGLNSLDEFEMKCRIVKGKIDGKAELTQILPIGFNVTDTVIGNTRMEFKNYTLSLYWDELPQDSIFEIAYNVQLDKIYGKLPMTSILYFENTDKEHKFDSAVFIKRKIVAEPIAVVEEVPTEDEMQSPSEKVEFRIQVRASYKKKLSVAALNNQFKLDKQIEEEKIGNWYKYSIGSFKTYQEARAYRKELVRNSIVKDAFIIAYYDDNRLNTLSELKEIAPEVLPGGKATQPEKPVVVKSGTCYRVQILASMSKKVAPSVLKDIYLLDVEVFEEVSHNWSKYTAGECLTRTEALQLRLELIKKGLKGAFIVKYKNGIRVI